MIDMVVPRGQMRDTVGAMLSILMARRAEVVEDEPELPLPEPAPAARDRRAEKAAQKQRPKAAE
jgi:hypothetical protein